MGITAIIEKYGMIALGLLLSITLIALGVSRYQVVKLKGDLALCEQQKKTAIEANTSMYQQLMIQNNAVDDLKKKAEEDKAKYVEDLKRIQPSIQKHDNTIKAVNGVSITSNECEDIKNIIDQWRGGDV